MEMQIPTTMIYIILALELLQKEIKEKKEKREKGKEIPNVDKDTELLELYSYIAGEVVNWYNHCGKQLGSI